MSANYVSALVSRFFFYKNDNSKIENTKLEIAVNYRIALDNLKRQRWLKTHKLFS